MMSLWHLVWIIPLSVTAGIFIACLAAAATERDELPWQK